MSQVKLFEGKVSNVEFHDTISGKRFMLIYVLGVQKPLAVPADARNMRMPNEGDHVSAMDATEGAAWFFLGHRSLIVGDAKQPVWTPKQKLTAQEKQAAYGLILNYAKGHLCKKEDEGLVCAECHEVMGSKFGTVNADGVADSLLAMFPDRNPHINGAFFLMLTKRGLLHPFGLTPTTRDHCHASKIPVYHLTKKGLEEAEKLL